MKRSKVITVISVVAVAIIATVMYLVQWANSPTTQNSIANAATSQLATPADQVVSTAYFKTSMSADFTVQVDENPRDSTMVQVSAFQKNGGNIQIGITLAYLPSDGLNGVANYVYRSHNTKQYQQISAADSPSGNITFNKIGGGETAAFLIHKNHCASVTVSGDGVDNQKLSALLVTVYENWQWL